MAKYCAASGCQTKSKQGITLHRFPPDPQQRLEWTEFVRRSGRGNSWTPRPQSLLCSLHFAPSCYVRNLTCLSQYSPQALRILDHGALPTISASPCCTTAESEATSSKQRRLEVCLFVLPVACSTYSSPSRFSLHLSSLKNSAGIHQRRFFVCSFRDFGKRAVQYKLRSSYGVLFYELRYVRSHGAVCMGLVNYSHNIRGSVGCAGGVASRAAVSKSK